MSPENANFIEDAPHSSKEASILQSHSCSSSLHPPIRLSPRKGGGILSCSSPSASLSPQTCLTPLNRGPYYTNSSSSSSHHHHINKVLTLNSNNLQFNNLINHPSSSISTNAAPPPTTNNNNNTNANNNNSNSNAPNVATNQNSGPLDNTLPTRLDNGLPPRYDEDVNIKLVKVVVLGAQGVGKTSIVRRFVRNEYSLSYEKSTSKSEYFPSLILNERLFELKIIDLPVIPYFPSSSASEWTPEFRYFGLRSAGAYVLVYDSPASFQFLKSLKEQICASRDMSNIPVIVVANKMDLFSGGSPLSRERKEICHLVRKSWRMSHIECSARYNWNVSNVFRELAVTLDMIANGEVIRSQHSVRKRRCLMF